jgi:signal transduction histidine kinase
MRRRKTAIFFLVLGISLSALAIALNVGWILLNLREVVLLVLGIIFFALIITGLILNTIFLVREIRRSEQHDAFLNAVTHELKTPIASLKLYLDTLKSRDVSEGKRREFYEVMTADSDRLLNTVEQVLQASRTREAGRVMDVDDLKIGDVIRDAITAVLARYNLDESAIRFIETGDLDTIGDREELYTAFLNLLDNAVKYSPEEKKISVRAKPSATGAKIDIVIRDNGVGIPASDLKRVFKRFYRVPGSASRSIKGTGLGLFIVEAIVKRHGGRIRAESKGEGRGTTFFIQLPRN